MENDEQSASAELLRLRALGAWMREVGALELELGGLRIKLAPKPPVAPGRASSADADERRVLEGEELEIAMRADAKRAHDEYWRRLTRSSGAPIPAFEGMRARP